MSDEAAKRIKDLLQQRTELKEKITKIIKVREELFSGKAYIGINNGWHCGVLSHDAWAEIDVVMSGDQGRLEMELQALDIKLAAIDAIMGS